MKLTILAIIGVYSFIIIYGLHHYESQKAKLQKESTYWANVYHKHLTQTADLDRDNKALQNQVEQLKLVNSELRAGIHTGYPSKTI